MNTYHVNSIFLTLQGEGFWTGRAAVFCRFSRCNLWTGHEKHRARAVCRFCDTDFVASHPREAYELANHIASLWLGDTDPMVVFTGGEPLLQLDDTLCSLMHDRGFYIAAETNGTQPRPRGIDWLCMSPKAGTDLAIVAGDELKVVWPQPVNLDACLNMGFDHFWLSPMDGPNLAENTAEVVDYVQRHPQWRLNVQTHKKIGIR